MDFNKRILTLRNYMKENKIAFSIIMHPDNQHYFSGFFVRNYSRPIVLVIEHEKTTLIVPGLERKHAEGKAFADNINVYYEHPEKAVEGSSHLEFLTNLLNKYPADSKAGIEFGSMTVALGSFLKNFNFGLTDIGEKVATMRMIKDSLEIEALIGAGELVSLALRESLNHAQQGISEVELDSYGNNALFEEATKKYPDAALSFRVMSPSGLNRSEMPHVFSNTRVLEDKEIIIHSRHVTLHGYMAELERTFFIGSPTTQQEEAFNIMVEAQEAAMKVLAPGVKAKEVDKAAREIIQRAGYGEYFIHRTGHGLGLSVHEGPYLRFDSDLVLQEGMVVSIEPGIYIPNVGGFRHSDTLIVTAEGSKIITHHPRDLKNLIF